MRKILIGFSAVIAATGLVANAGASINYNASKSNTAAVRCHVSHGHRTCTRSHAQASDANRGLSAGKRRHKPATTYDRPSGQTAGKRMH